MPRSDGEPRFSVGGPLYLAEARYLQHELERIGLKAKVHSDRSLGPRRGRIHSVLVAPEDLKTAELAIAKSELLDESDEVDESTRRSDPRRRRSRKSAAILAMLGFITGLRVGARSLGSVWLGIALAVALSAIAFHATRMFYPSPRE